MNDIPKQYADMPNLWRVACELAKFKDPHKACDMLLALAGPMLKESGLPQKERKEAEVRA